MSRDSRIQLLAAALMAVLFAVGGVLSVAVSTSIGRNRLAYTDRAEEGQPVEVNLGIAMGAFRGLFVNWLWIRANELKEEGKYFEAIELARAITKLQPRFPKVWQFHAWNLAYNISVATQTREERWEWVQAGIRLLRSEGVPANPNDLQIHRELAWIYLHKVQGWMDDANVFYKKRHAEEWTYVMGPPPPRLAGSEGRVRESVIEQYARWLARIAEAPTPAQLRADDPLVDELATRLVPGAVDALGMPLLERYEQTRAARRSARRESMERMFGPRSRAFAALLDDPRFADAWERLIPAVRRAVLEGEYNMEPRRMIRYTRKYGPIDWRHPAAHGLYWSARGVEQALTRVTERNRKDFDFLNTDRIVLQSAQELYRTGEIYFDVMEFYITDRQGGFYLAVPNEWFFPTYGDLLSDVVERSIIPGTTVKAEGLQRAYTLIGAGYENFVKDAIRFFYRRGQRDVAEKYKLDLIRFAGQNINDPHRNAELARPLDEWIQEELKDRFTSPSVAVSEVTGALLGAFSTGLLGGDNELFSRQITYAADAHAFFMREQRRQGVVDATAARMDQMPADFGLMAGGVFAQFITGLSLDDARLLYSRAPDSLRVYAYDPLKAQVGQQFEEGQRVVDKPFDTLFPPPPGLEQHRVRLRALLEEAQRGRGTIEAR
ncbi:MAG: hypothetical protein FJ255_06905 [Phycisphaerae bacterium]|nr:hypothetical protein [Phycisphaerae bacterium]